MMVISPSWARRRLAVRPRFDRPQIWLALAQIVKSPAVARMCPAPSLLRIMASRGRAHRPRESTRSVCLGPTKGPKGTCYVVARVNVRIVYASNAALK